MRAVGVHNGFSFYLNSLLITAVYLKMKYSTVTAGLSKPVSFPESLFCSLSLYSTLHSITQYCRSKRVTELMRAEQAFLFK